ncbi:aminoglycoside 6-adenylyltransferase, partial [Chromobacterium haemolyticum]|uniref:aminoglycoside 6-adenylyltransferase n=1 Tax=Chromobacterium haemolyticum TaxID=394935 RepID=UPI0009F0D07B
TTSSVCGTLSPAADHRTIKQYHYHANLGLLSLSLVWLEGEDQLDKTGAAQGLPAPQGRIVAPALPSEERFRERVEEFWFEAFHIPKYLARGELFVVKFRDWTMKELLLEMLEWHAHSRPGATADCWHIGTGLQRWAEPAHWQALHQAFGRFDAADAERAFHATLRLYSQVAREVAARAGFDYPEAVEAGIRDLIAPA